MMKIVQFRYINKIRNVRREYHHRREKNYSDQNFTAGDKIIVNWPKWPFHHRCWHGKFFVQKLKMTLEFKNSIHNYSKQTLLVMSKLNWQSLNYDKFLVFD